VTETDLELSDGRTLHVYDTGADGADGRLAVFWHHGTPNIGAPPEPLFAAAARLGIRWVSYDRPGYGRSTPYPGREVASAAAYVCTIADALGIDRFAVMGHSGGAPHALACAALLPERRASVRTTACIHARPHNIPWSERRRRLVRNQAPSVQRGGIYTASRVHGHPPSGRTVAMGLIDIVHISEGRVVEHWSMGDNLGMMQQLGVIPSGETSEEARPT
jgi:pimeloyl-ACP methyl ester carboxylesterase